MRAAWQQVDHSWDQMITERRQPPALAVTDASDLILRIGRLVRDDPHWTPARSHRAPLRPAAAVAPGAADFTAVVAAVHQAADALSVAANADARAVAAAAAAAGQLYVPTRSLPGYYDVPRPYAPAPAARCQRLQDAYDAALHASSTLTRALEELAVAAAAPSRILALARTAATAQSHQRGSRSQPDDSIPRSQLAAGTRYANIGAPPGQAGPAEQAVRNRGISDPVMLLRAAAIDSAARRLIASAEHPASPSRPALPPQSEQHPASTVAQLAAQSFPGDGGMRSTPLPSPPARPVTNSGSRTTSQHR